MKWYRLFDNEAKLLTALGPEGRRVVRIGDKKICLFHEEGAFYVFDNLCPHNMHSLLEGKINYLKEIVCPLHGYRYNLRDGRECEGRSGDLSIHKLELRNEGVFLGLENQSFECGPDCLIFPIVATPTALLKPTDVGKRIVSIDILRGFAVLGILIMNIQSYSMPASAYLNPTSFETLTGNHLWVWLVSHTFADHKFIAIFSMLFGASIIMLSNKAKKEHLRSGNLQSRRFTILLVIGLIHAYLLWSGDILVAYAICGFLMYYFRGKKSQALFRAGFVFLLIGSGISLMLGYSVPFWEPGQFEALRDRIWSPDTASIREEIELYTSNWERQMLIRAPSAFELQTQVFISDTFWRVSGLMLLGMGFYKKRVFSTKQSRKYYVKMVVYGLGTGLPLVVGGTILHFHYNWDFQLSFFYLSQLNYWGSILMAIGYIGLVMILVKAYSRGLLTKWLAMVGRMALSNYLLQSIICSFIFYGHGFGLFGDLDRSAQAFIVLVIWVFLIFFSAFWLRFFKYGPFEWLWRSLTYGQVQSITRPRY